jgi:broad specificity phosphatase PhoE
MIKEIINQYSEVSKLSLLIRHGDRDNIPQGSFGNEILLNENGKLNSLNFGRSIDTLRVNKIVTSPVARCVQTAEFIAKGYGKSIDIVKSTALGAPGLHIIDEKVAGEFYLTHGFDEMYNQFLNHREIPGIPSQIQIEQSITKYLTENSDQNGITLFISHDMLIAFYHFSLNKTVYTKENWINYLNGILLVNGKLKA